MVGEGVWGGRRGLRAEERTRGADAAGRGEVVGVIIGSGAGEEEGGAGGVEGGLFEG